MKNSAGKKQEKAPRASDSKTGRMQPTVAVPDGEPVRASDEITDCAEELQSIRAIDRSVRSLSTPPGEPYNDPGLRRK